MTYELFRVGIYDYTQYLDTKSYTAREVDVTEIWEDAYRVRHVDLVRKRVVGTARLLFLSASAYNTFIDRLTAARTASGTYNLRVRCGLDKTTGNMKQITAIAEITPRIVYATEAYDGNPAVMEVTIQFEEA